MSLTLRDYQRDAVAAVRAAWAGGMRRPAIVLPTGAGKTVVFAELAREWLARRHAAGDLGARVVVVAHRDELLNQAVSRLRSTMPGLPVGVVAGSRNETLAPVIVAGVLTLASERRRLMLRGVGLIIVDECHHATARSYVDVLTHYGALGPGPAGALALGCTATMARDDGMALGAVWQDVVYQIGIPPLISRGHLVRPIGRRVYVEDLDLDKVKLSRGDYADGALGTAIAASLAPKAVAEAVAEHAAGRPLLAFAPTVEVAGLVCDALREAGRRVALVHGKTPKDERSRHVSAFKAGELDALSNCGIFTEGTDLPLASCAVLARPTKSAVLFTQMVGRVLRPWPGKTDALVLDVAGASTRHSLSVGVELLGDEARVRRVDELGEGDGLGGGDLGEGGDDLSLALFGEGAGAGLAPRFATDGPLAHVEVDLFRGSDSAWLRTLAGTWFLPAGERLIAILPSRAAPGAWDVTAMHRSRPGTGVWVVLGVPELGYAMAHAESEVSAAEMATARRDRSWRARPPSGPQRQLAAGLRIAVDPGARSGEVSNLIAVALASGRIDPIVAGMGSR